MILQEKKLNYNIDQIIEEVKEKKSYLIGISGICGAGKSYIANEIKQKLENSIVLQMDGYHKYRKDLDENGVKYRGAPYTFDKERFINDLMSLKQKKEGQFPSFDHSIKDPVENDIIIKKSHKHIIVEGLYLFLKEWNLYDLFDYKIFINCNFDQAMERAAVRNFKAGIVDSLEKSKIRIEESDQKNAKYILNNQILKEDVVYLEN